MNLIVKGANAVGSLIMRLPDPWNTAVHLTARHWRTKKIADVNVEKEVSWIPLACLQVKLSWNNTFAQQETSGATVMMSPSGRTSERP